MDAVFTNTATSEVAAPAETENGKKEKMSQMKQALKAVVSTDPTFQEKLRRLSGSLKVVNTLGYGVGGNIVVDKQAKGGDRTLKQTSQIVGYKVENVGDEPIPYTTEEWTKGDDGKFVGQVVQKTIQPGEIIHLTRMYMTMLCAIPEISFTLANGKIVASSKKCKSIKEELSAYYFSFNKAEDGSVAQVNDDEVKISIDVDGVVTDEYVATFGYLNNPKETRAPKTGKGSKFTTQDLAANWVNSLLQQNGI